MTPDTDRLIHAYIEGDLTPEQAAGLSAWVEQSDANAEHFVCCCIQHYLLREQAVGKDLAESAFSAEGEIADEADGLTGPDFLKDLAHLEARAQASQERSQIRSERTWSLTKKTYLSAFSYVIEHTFTPKRLAMMAAAAILMLGCVLAVFYLAGGSDNDQQIVEVPRQPSEMPQQPQQPHLEDEPVDLPIVVATLTAEHDAVWDRRPGEDLYPGQRFTLSGGYAEITTRRGAVAIVEAPARIELIDNPNAIHLYSGKLVGICETKSSKGLLVRTPHLDVTDLGTRFGVDASVKGQTQVHVFNGHVELSPAGVPEGFEPVELIAGQSARVTAESQKVVLHQEPGLQFVRDWQAVTSQPTLQGSVRFSPATPISLSFNQTESNDIQLFHERSGYRLREAIQVSDRLSADGHELGPFEMLSAGTQVDSYLVHFDVQGSNDPNQGLRRRCSIRFDRPILGLIIDKQSLLDSHRLFGVAGVLYPGMEESAIPAGNSSLDFDVKDPALDDHFTISDDRRELTLDLHCSSGTDQLRVLVQAEESQP